MKRRSLYAGPFMRALYAGLKLNAALTGTGLSRRFAKWLDWVRHSASMCTLRDPG